MRYADRVDRRRLYAAGATLGIVAWAVLVYAEGSLPVLLAYAVMWGFSAGIGAQAFYSVWTSELFATRYRASAQGILFFAARCAVGGLSYWFPTLLTQQGVPFVGTLMIGLLAVALVVGTAWAPDTQGKTLPEIEAERYGEVLDRDLTQAREPASTPSRAS
jgi:inositol transporter-like SP family MFS transporter